MAGLQIYTTSMSIRIPFIRGNVPGIYLDEMNVSPGLLNAINVNDIAIIKIIKTPFLGGFNGGNGAIAIYTHGGEEEEEIKNERTLLFQSKHPLIQLLQYLFLIFSRNQ